jgi:hypothetical protein
MDVARLRSKLRTLFNEANGRSFREKAEDRSVDYAVKRDFGL